MDLLGWLRSSLGLKGRLEKFLRDSDSSSGSLEGGLRWRESPDEPLSRVQQNLSWLPVYQAPEPFSTPPPGCPSVWERDAGLLARYLAYVTAAEKIGWRALSQASRETGRELAAEWRSRGIDLSCAKATEQSEGIYWYFQGAAIASLFADGPKSDAFARYRKDVESYRRWRMAGGQVQLFDEYVSVIASEAQLRPGTE
ncbi:hypothetical protein [Pseudomonas huanghezhanensis]|uniref:hypothetical protein n=1 Tax=Pseudomonas huanghezhanensis TaxID=3002903 RepID=UPI0022862555|nr:hypothetical protein [Pseudomonas sp. BSw22131]